MLLRKGVYPYEHKWEQFNERSLPEKREFYNNLNMENIRDTDQVHAKGDFE